MNEILIKRMKEKVLLYNEGAEREKWLLPLAEYLGLSVHTVHNWIRGENKPIPNKHTQKIREAINKGII